MKGVSYFIRLLGFFRIFFWGGVDYCRLGWHPPPRLGAREPVYNRDLGGGGEIHGGKTDPALSAAEQPTKLGSVPLMFASIQSTRNLQKDLLLCGLMVHDIFIREGGGGAGGNLGPFSW